MRTFRLEVLNMYTRTPTYSQTYMCIHMLTYAATRAQHKRAHTRLCTHVDSCVHVKIDINFYPNSQPCE